MEENKDLSDLDKLIISLYSVLMIFTILIIVIGILNAIFG